MKDLNKKKQHVISEATKLSDMINHGVSLLKEATDTSDEVQLIIKLSVLMQSASHAMSEYSKLEDKLISTMNDAFDENGDDCSVKKSEDGSVAIH